MERVVISNSLSDLTGNGLEYYVDDEGEIIAVFIDGNIERQTSNVPEGETI